MDVMHLAAAILLVSSPGETVLLDFRADYCGPCRQMDPLMHQLASEGYPVRAISLDDPQNKSQNQALASQYGAKYIPCFVMLVDGREVDRVTGPTSRDRIEAMFRKGGVGPATKSVRGQSPETTTPELKPVPFPASGDGLSTVNGIPMPRMPQTPRANANSQPIAARPRREERLPESQPLSQPTGVQGGQYDHLVRASVRLRIEDGHGNSRGSGTIIDAREGEALILTCGHVFRDAAKNGQISVDFFGPGAPQNMPGKLVGYDLKSDVGLLSVETNYPVAVAHLAPASLQLKRGDKVISVGCDGGADATPRETQVTSINRYMEPKSNIQVAFQPVQGRSGGGLFTPEGWVIGVCNAADPQDNEGLFAGLPVVHEELDKAGLGFVYKDMPTGAHGVADGRLQAAFGRRQASGGRQPSEAPAWPAAGQSPVVDSSIAREQTPVAQSSQSIQSSGGQLSADERKMLEMLQAKAQDAEVVCIIRPKGNPNAKSEVIVIDRASPEFVRQLGSREPRGQQRLTSLDSPASPPRVAQPPAQQTWPSEQRR
jgi:thiol-disulfide isomerase/thioredoxin